MAARERESRWPLMGRDRELAAFDRAWRDRNTRGVALFGAAGVGKSRLAEECLARAVRGGMKGGRATASAAAATVPLGAIAHLIPAGLDLADPVNAFAAVARGLAGPQRRKWALLIDDLHLLDAASAVLLQQLMDAGVVRLIGTVRSGEPTGDTVRALCNGDAVHRIDLSEFDEPRTQYLLEKVLDGPVGRYTLHELYSASRGNVLYLRELVNGALESGALSSDGEIWELAEALSVGTPQLADLISVRLATAEPAARPALDLLALCEPVPLADAEAVSSLELLTGLEATGLIRVTSHQQRTSVSLAHPLYGEILRAQITPLRRRTLLMRQAERTESHGARRRDDALHVASWRLAATGAADSELLVRAAAVARYAHDYRQAGTLLQAVPDREHTTASRLMLGEVLFELGDAERAEAVLADATARAATEQETIAVTMTRTFNLYWAAARAEEAFAVNDSARARVHSERGLRILRYNEGSMRIASAEPERGLALLADLEENIHDSADPVAWLTGAFLRAQGLEMTGRTEEAVAWAEHAYACHREVDQRTLYPHPATQLLALTFALTSHGRLADALEVGERAYAELAAARTAPIPQMWLAIYLGRAEWMAGHPASARRWCAEAAAQARARKQVRPLGRALAFLAASAAALGDLAAAEQACAEARHLPSVGLNVIEQALGQAWLAAARGQLAEARMLLTAAAGRARAAGLVTAEATMLTDIARLGAAADVTGRLAELAEGCEGELVPARARMAAALAAGDPDRLLAVAEDLVTIGADLLAAEAAAAAASAWRRAGQRRAAAAADQRADACATRCQGARTPLLSTAKAADALTVREREIALLAAAGTTSKDIANNLSLSVRTVDNHLQNAYAKLGVSTRRQLAEHLGLKDTPLLRRPQPSGR